MINFNEISSVLSGWLVPGRDSKIFLESKASWARTVEELPQVCHDGMVIDEILHY